MSLMIIHDHTLIEHISLLTDNIRMVLKDDSLGIVVTKEVILDFTKISFENQTTYVHFEFEI